MKTFETSKEEFMKKNYVTCENCGYNNERARFLQFGRCLKCKKILDKKTHYMIEMMKKIKDNERKSR
jgi:predicted Zn-ribbon and HTH transcriptional regulator